MPTPVNYHSKFFESVEDSFELQRGLNNCFAYDLVPGGPIIESALKAARRLNDFPTAVRVFEGIKEKVENPAQYKAYLDEFSALRKELGGQSLLALLCHLLRQTFVYAHPRRRYQGRALWSVAINSLEAVTFGDCASTHDRAEFTIVYCPFIGNKSNFRLVRLWESRASMRCSYSCS